MRYLLKKITGFNEVKENPLDSIKRNNKIQNL